ncbi:MAG: OmpA family protein [Proteobacteria bacterium]|nr:OmpA family protein [Pseudomonadota bacterium]
MMKHRSGVLRTKSAVAALGVLGVFAMGLAQAQEDVKFPDLASTSLKTGDFIGPDQPARVRPGMNKDQVRLELGNPHFSEGLFGVSEWDYAFNFYTGKGNEYITCQFKVKYGKSDGDYRVASTHWKGANCPPPVTQVAAAPVMPMPMQQCKACGKTTMRSDGLFRFNGAKESDLLPEGRRQVEALASSIKSDAASIRQVVVTGYTDRLGGEEYNNRLSLARAKTVASILTGRGVDPSLIRAVGMGEKNPVTTGCQGNAATPQLISCLQLDRRVEIEVVPAQ